LAGIVPGTRVAVLMTDQGANFSSDTTNTQLELERLRADTLVRLKQSRNDVLKVVFGTMIVGIAAAFFPFAQELARSVFAERIEKIKTDGEYNRLSLAQGLEKTKQLSIDLAARRSYLESLAKEARSEIIEKQIVAAEFFSFLAEPDMRKPWEDFREYLTKKQERLNSERATLLAGSIQASPAERSSAEERLRQIDRLQNPGGSKTSGVVLPMPPLLPGESRQGRRMLGVALDVLASPEPFEFVRWSAFLQARGIVVDDESALFVSWLFEKAFYLSRRTEKLSELWKGLREDGITKAGNAGSPVAGDLVLVGGANDRWIGIVYAVKSDGLTIIAGPGPQVRTVSMQTVAEYAHIPDP
jgi:hypothetical protein